MKRMIKATAGNIQPGIRIFVNNNFKVPTYRYSSYTPLRLKSRIRKIEADEGKLFILPKDSPIWVYLENCYIIVNK